MHNTGQDRESMIYPNNDFYAKQNNLATVLEIKVIWEKYMYPYLVWIIAVFFSKFQSNA